MKPEEKAAEKWAQRRCDHFYSNEKGPSCIDGDCRRLCVPKAFLAGGENMKTLLWPAWLRVCEAREDKEFDAAVKAMGDLLRSKGVKKTCRT